VRRSCITAEVREKRLPDAQHARDDRNRDHPRHERGEEAELDARLIGLWVDLDRRVEHRAEEERRDDAERGRDDDQPADEAEPWPVRAEQPDDATQVRLAHRRVFRALDRALGLARIAVDAHRGRVRTAVSR